MVDRAHEDDVVGLTSDLPAGQLVRGRVGMAVMEHFAYVVEVELGDTVTSIKWVKFDRAKLGGAGVAV